DAFAVFRGDETARVRVVEDLFQGEAGGNRRGALRVCERRNGEADQEKRESAVAMHRYTPRGLVGPACRTMTGHGKLERSKLRSTGFGCNRVASGRLRRVELARLRQTKSITAEAGSYTVHCATSRRNGRSQLQLRCFSQHAARASRLKPVPTGFLRACSRCPAGTVPGI